MAVSTPPPPEKGAESPPVQAQAQAKPPVQKPQPKPIFTDFASI
jgi:hypothetical protein